MQMTFLKEDETQCKLVAFSDGIYFDIATVRTKCEF